MTGLNDESSPCQGKHRADLSILLRPELLERLRQAQFGCAIPGASEIIASAVSAANAVMPALAKCLEEVDAVLKGDRAACDRLWLVLRSAATLPRKTIPASVLDRVVGEARRREPRLIQGSRLVDLVAGTVRAANRPDEAEAMLEALGRLLDPLFDLEIAWHAAGQALDGFAAPLRTLVTATEYADPPEMHTLDEKGSEIWKERRIFDTSAWHYYPFSSSLQEWKWLWDCMGSGHLYASQIDRFGPRYTILSISNPNACAGQKITIRGTGFGLAGRVFFPVPDADDPAFVANAALFPLTGVEAARWTDTEIDVVVPPWATSGELHLNAFHTVTDICLTKDIYRLGNSFLFTGGLASIIAVYISGQEIDLDSNDRICINPRDAVALSYRATNRPDVRVTVEIQAGGASLFKRENLAGGFNAIVLQPNDPLSPQAGELTITATSACGSTLPRRIPVWIAVPATLRIEFIEVTQGVQAGRDEVAAGRAVPLVAIKDTAVRVYLNSDRGGWNANRLNGVTGSLRITTNEGDRVVGPTNARPSVPDKGFIEVFGLSRDVDDTSTLNFLLPAGWCTAGAHTLTVTVLCNDPCGKIKLTQALQWTWFAKNPLRVRWMFLNSPAYAQYGTWTQADGFLRDALHFLPTPVYDVGPAWKKDYTHDYDLTDGGDWEDLLDDIEGFKHCTVWDDINPFADHCESIDDGCKWVVIIFPGTNITGSGQTGRSSTPGEVAMTVMTAYIAAHELGHTLGLHHINLTEAGSSVPDPFDNVENGGYLGRAAFDVQKQKAIFRNPKAMDNKGNNSNEMPADLMSYFEPLFLSVTNWNRLFNTNFD